MRELSAIEVNEVSGGISSDTVYSTAVGVAGGFLALGLGITAPVWGTGLLLGGSIFASFIAINELV